MHYTQLNALSQTEAARAQTDARLANRMAAEAQRAAGLIARLLRRPPTATPAPASARDCPAHAPAGS